MKMADADVANFEVMEDVDIMSELYNSIPGVNVQSETVRGKNVLEEASGHVDERKPPADNSSANKKGWLSVRCELLMLRKKGTCESKTQNCQTKSRRTIKKYYKKDGKCFL
jgi:hypothetical protein